MQAALPSGHRGTFFAKTVTLQPDTIVRSYPFQWGAVVPCLGPKIDPNAPVHSMPTSSTNMPIVGGLTGTPVTTTKDSTVVTFTLPTAYPVEDGVIGNGTVTFKFKNGTGPLVTCTYKGGSSNAMPRTCSGCKSTIRTRFLHATRTKFHRLARRFLRS